MRYRQMQSFSMISLIDRYLLQEIIRALLAILVLLLLIFFGTTFIKLMQQVAVGDLNSILLFKMLGLEILRFLARLVPPAFFFAVLYAMGRLYRDSEIIAMEACGIGGFRLFSAILFATLPAALLVSWLSLAVSPWAARNIADLLSSQHGQAMELAGVSAGRFNEYSQGNLIFYVESISDKDHRMHNVLVQHRKQQEVGLISAERGYQTIDERSGDRFLVLENGYRYQGIPGAADYRVSEFAEYALRIKEAGPSLIKRPWKGMSNRALWESGNIRDQIELQVRVSQILALLVVALLAMPLSRTAPRQGPYGRLVLAFLIYTLYLSLQGASEKWMLDRVTPTWLGIWWVHLMLALLALTLFLPDTVTYRRWRQRLLGWIRSS
jgi:lipopolysaccharide export system permease protein